MIALYRRFTALERSQRRLVVEAAALIAIVSIGLRLHRFLMLRRMLDRLVALTMTRDAIAHPSVIDCVRRAIASVAVRFPAATCLTQALAADAMLRRRRLGCQLRLGVRLRDDGAAADVPIEAHAWVECDGGVVIGAVAHQADFKVLTR